MSTRPSTNYANSFSMKYSPNSNQSHREPLKKTHAKTQKNSHLLNILAEVMKTIIDENINHQLQNTLKNANYQNTDFKQEKQQSVQKKAEYQIVLISNQNNLQKSKFGQKYRDNLDPRDQMLPHLFKFILQIRSSELIGENGKSTFIKSHAYQTLCMDIEQYLVDVVQNVISVSFNLLITGKLKQNESKDYASKNILLNVRSIFKQIMQTLTKQNVIDDKERKKLRYVLCELVDNTLKRVIDNLSSYYPQAPPTGGTPRMREALLSIDRNYNEELDFLYTQNLKLKREENGDYTEYIMKVVNRVIQVTHQVDPKDPFQQTLFQKFVAFSEHLFWVVQDDSYKNIIQNMAQDLPNDKQSEDQSQRLDSIDKQSEVKSIYPKGQLQRFEFVQVPEPDSHCNFFSPKVDKPKIKMNVDKTKHQVLLKNLKNSFLNSKNHNKKLLISTFMRKTVFAQYSNATLIDETNKQKTIQKMKKRHDFSIGQKIPISVKPFSQKDLIDKNFSAKNSAVLRILTKWAQNLQNIIDNPQAFTTNRSYPFKTLNHEIIYPIKQLKQVLCQQIAAQKQKKQKIKQYLLNRNKVFQSAFLAKDNNANLSKFIKRYTETRVMASKMNALLIQFMKEYVSSLINILVDAGKTTLSTEYMDKEYQIDLVVFKIGDLMRSKIHCSETTFIRLLKTLYILDDTNDHEHQKPMFQLVRIKNKLDSRDNNILVNYLFMGRVQCQLQMSVQKTTGKELNYYSFAHFLYELSRGKFGVLAECATIISQYDPILSSGSSDHYYEPKRSKKQNKVIKNQYEGSKVVSKISLRVNKKRPSPKEQVLVLKLNQRQQKASNKIFICKKCDQLKFDENVQFLSRNEQQRQICNQCIIDSTTRVTMQILHNENLLSSNKHYGSERLLKDEKLLNWIIEMLKNEQIVKLLNYQQLSYRSSKCLIFSINPNKNQLQFHLFSKQKSQEIFFVCRIAKDLWQKDMLNDQKVSYEIITQKIKKAVSFPDYTYIVPISTARVCLNVLQQIKFIKMQQALSRLQGVQAKCKQKILKQSIFNNLRNKNQSLQFNSSSKKLQVMTRLLSKNMINSYSKSKWIQESLNHIQCIFAQEMNIQVLPNWFTLCQQTQLLNLSDNKIQDLSPIQEMRQIKELILRTNQIRQIDWKKFIHLQRLNVSDNSLTSFSMNNLPESLLQIDVGDNSITNLNLQILPSSLKKLQAYGNNLTTINLKNMPWSLEYLDFSHNRIQLFEYPWPLIDHSQLSHLKLLFLDSNNLVSFKCDNMASLLQFAISQNKNLVNFQVKNCPSLKKLSIGSTNMRKLQIIDLPALTELYIHNNMLLSQLSLKQLPSIHLIDMGSLSPGNFIGLQVENINQERVMISGYPQMLSFLKTRFPSVKFEEAEIEQEYCYSFDKYEQFSNG